MCHCHPHCLFFFFNDTATTEIYTLSLHDALPILIGAPEGASDGSTVNARWLGAPAETVKDRKSTRLNSSHGYISYAVFCLKKKKKDNPDTDTVSEDDGRSWMARTVCASRTVSVNS